MRPGGRAAKDAELVNYATEFKLEHSCEYQGKLRVTLAVGLREQPRQFGHGPRYDRGIVGSTALAGCTALGVLER